MARPTIVRAGRLTADNIGAFVRGVRTCGLALRLRWLRTSCSLHSSAKAEVFIAAVMQVVGGEALILMADLDSTEQGERSAVKRTKGQAVSVCLRNWRSAAISLSMASTRAGSAWLRRSRPASVPFVDTSIDRTSRGSVVRTPDPGREPGVLGPSCLRFSSTPPVSPSSEVGTSASGGRADGASCPNSRDIAGAPVSNRATCSATPATLSADASEKPIGPDRRDRTSRKVAGLIEPSALSQQ